MQNYFFGNSDLGAVVGGGAVADDAFSSNGESDFADGRNSNSGGGRFGS